MWKSFCSNENSSDLAVGPPEVTGAVWVSDRPRFKNKKIAPRGVAVASKDARLLLLGVLVGHLLGGRLSTRTTHNVGKLTACSRPQFTIQRAQIFAEQPKSTERGRTTCTATRLDRPP